MFAVEVAEPPEGMETLVGLKDTEIPDGAEADRETLLEKPPTLVKVIVEPPDVTLR